MREANLRRFALLYGNSRWFGADATLRDYLSLPSEHVIPLALPHGVDFGHVDPVQDLLAVEPIHWAHNAWIAAAAAPYKPVVAIPHPFLLELWRQPKVPRSGTLVVGPPPGPANDQSLLKLLGHIQPVETTILVKPKPGFGDSMKFWRERGFAVATLADFGSANYRTMAQLLRRQERVIGCTFSSLVVFAAAAGAEIELLRGYRYDCYDLIETGSRFEVINWQSPRAISIVREFATGSQVRISERAHEILGGQIDRDPQRLREQLDQAVANLAEPVYWRRRHWGVTRWLAAESAARLGRPGLLRFDTERWLRRHFRPEIWARELDEIGAWLEGHGPKTIAEVRCRYVARRTEPGDAVRQY